MTKLRDEELVVLAKECGFLPARQELLVRSYEWMRRQIVLNSRRMGLGGAEAEDAQEEGVFSLLEAIAKYDTRQLGKKDGRSFRSFLRQVLLARLRDYRKKVRRSGRRYDQSATARRVLEDAADHRPCAACFSALPGLNLSDPAAEIEWREQLARLQNALGQIDDRLQLLWERLALGSSMHDIAAEWGVSYHRIRRWRHRMLADLSDHLRAVNA
jgi:RNA polymerase sigma factor (sigma-70 family)